MNLPGLKSEKDTCAASPMQWHISCVVNTVLYLLPHRAENNFGTLPFVMLFFYIDSLPAAKQKLYVYILDYIIYSFKRSVFARITFTHTTIPPSINWHALSRTLALALPW